MEPARTSEADLTPAIAPRRDRGALIGLLGRGIQLSRTPAMHQAEAQARGIPYVYRLLDADLMGEPGPPLPDLLRFAEYLGFSGLNVTFPFKQEILPLLTELSPAAREVGSVNTVVLRNGLRSGHNTDVWGFRESFRRDMTRAAHARVLLLGAGGAGAAVAHALLDCAVGCVLVADTNRQRADRLAVRLQSRFGQDRARNAGEIGAAVATVDGIVNATPVGMAKLPGTPIPLDLVTARHWVADIIYFPLETEFLRHARRQGCRTLSGEGMAVFQAVRAFELFTGIQPDIDRMRAAFTAFDRAPAG